MEAVARQFGRGRVLIVRNGWFSFRWTQIFEAGGFAQETQVVMARQVGNARARPMRRRRSRRWWRRSASSGPRRSSPRMWKPASGIILPDDYIAAIAAAAHEVGALMVLDCIASGCIWVDMAATWGRCADLGAAEGLVGLSRGRDRGSVAAGRGAAGGDHVDIFALDLKKWRMIMAAYEDGGHAYHATMPTDAMVGFRDAMAETRAMGFAEAKAAQWALGQAVRAMLAAAAWLGRGRGVPGAGRGGQLTDDPQVQNGAKFREQGLQIAAGVPLQVGEGRSSAPSASAFSGWTS
jgi:hypothetical protein